MKGQKRTSIISKILLSIVGIAIVTLINYKVTIAANTSDVLLTIATGGLKIHAPSSGINLGSVMVSGDITYLSGQFTGSDIDNNRFWVEDLNGSDSGRIVTIQASNLSGAANNSGSYIPAENVYMKYDSYYELLGGFANPNIELISTFTGGYTSLGSGSKTFMMKASGGNIAVGKYGIQPWIKVDVPAYQNPGSYKGTITITLVEN